MNKTLNAHKITIWHFLLYFLIFMHISNKSYAIDPDPLQALKEQVHNDLTFASLPPNTGVNRSDYLAAIHGIINYFRNYQLWDGSILDPITEKETQYSTAYYALAGSVLYKSGFRTDPDFLESISLALDRATYELYTASCADYHSNFFTLPSVLAYENLRDDVDATRRAMWESRLTGMPISQYATHTMNWGLTAASGDYLRYVNGFTTDTSYMETWIGNNLPQLTSQGLFRDGEYPYAPMAYDGFARLNLNLILMRGYEETHFPGSEDLKEYMRRGAWTSLLMQSPWGEMPLGGRSSQHQWNETEMGFIYEVWAKIAKDEGDMVSARAFKRAAHLSFKSLLRWVQPNGSVWIVKNRMAPPNRFGYEIYSHLSQYNMWTAGFLALAWMYADDSIPEGPSPSDTGCYAFSIVEIHRAFANCQGLYLQIDMDPEDNYDVAGLVRLQKSGVEPLVSPSAPTTDLGVLKGKPELGTGIAWWTSNGWQSLADMDNEQIESFEFNINERSDISVSFSVKYNFSNLDEVASVTENYVLEPHQVTVSASIEGEPDLIKIRYAAFLFDGRETFSVGYDQGLAQTKLGDSLMTMRLSSHPMTTFFRNENWVNSRNGYLEAIEGVVEGQSLTYVLTPELDLTGDGFVAANQYSRNDFATYSSIPSYEVVAVEAGAEEIRAGNRKEYSVDNSNLTRWANDGSLSNAWIEYDLGSSQTIDSVFIDFYKGQDRSYPLRIEIDGTPVWSGQTSPSEGGWLQSFEPIMGRFVRIMMTGSNSDGHQWLSLYEVRIFSGSVDL